MGIRIPRFKIFLSSKSFLNDQVYFYEFNSPKMACSMHARHTCSKFIFSNNQWDPKINIFLNLFLLLIFEYQSTFSETLSKAKKKHFKVKYWNRGSCNNLAQHDKCPISCLSNITPPYCPTFFRVENKILRGGDVICCVCLGPDSSHQLSH